jgi:hypothetical protein
VTIEERIDRLEQQNRRLKLTLAVLVFVAIAAGLLGAKRDGAVQDIVKARAFHVVAEDGTALWIGTSSCVFGNTQSSLDV